MLVENTYKNLRR